MAKQLSVAVRNAMLDAYEATVGPAPKLQFSTGAQPANCAAARTGTLLSEAVLPSDWLAAAAGGVKSIANGPYAFVGLPAAGSGTAIGHYSVMDNAGITCHDQGSVTVTGGGGDMTMDNINIANAQTGSIATWSITAPHA